MGEIKKCGVIAIVGRPNVGKSTLTNALVGDKVAIVSSKPQTTRNRITGVVNRGNCQFVLLDTPGLHRARTRLGDYMVKVVHQSVSNVDAVVLVVEPIANIGEPEQELINRIRKLNCPAVLAINKVDTVKKESILEVIDVYRQALDWNAILPISAKRGEGLEELLTILADFLPEGPALFPEGMTSDQPERQVAAEIIREKLLQCLNEEIPHGTMVEVTRWVERDDGVIEMQATIYCEKKSHKRIIIGKQGAMIKRISTLAREDIEAFMGTKVYLETWVKVKENWRNDVAQIRNFGYTED
ncbi:MAG: GTPase Era [Oscillospiraceae bacterium]|nr:GTPase Era [Oscillospiraceae bacterium]